MDMVNGSLWNFSLSFSKYYQNCLNISTPFHTQSGEWLTLRWDDRIKFKFILSTFQLRAFLWSTTIILINKVFTQLPALHPYHSILSFLFRDRSLIPCGLKRPPTSSSPGLASQGLSLDHCLRAPEPCSGQEARSVLNIGRPTTHTEMSGP